MTTAEILNAAADLIVERGWNRWGFVPEGIEDWPAGERALCPVDVLAAIAIAAPNRTVRGGVLEYDDDFFDVLDCPGPEGAMRALAGHLGLGNDGPLHGRDGLIHLLGGDRDGGWNELAESGERVIAELRAAATESTGANS